MFCFKIPKELLNLFANFHYCHIQFHFPWSRQADFSFFSSLSLFFLLFFSYIFTYFPFFLYLMHQKSHHFPAVNPSITSYGLKNNIPNLWLALESFDFIFSLTAHCTPATLVFFLWKCQTIAHLGALHQ